MNQVLIFYLSQWKQVAPEILDNHDDIYDVPDLGIFLSKNCNSLTRVC